MIERRRGAATLTVAEGWLERCVAAGLERAEGWQQLLSGERGGSGRGTTAVLRLPQSPPLRIKQLCRGGLIGPLWRERYPGRGRPLANLMLPLAAVERGAPTPATVALMTLAGPPGLYRAWLALEEIEPAVDLMQLLREEGAPAEGEWRALIGAVRRLHDVGVEHPDLNLGNLLLQRPERGDPIGWVLDLDRARLHPGGLPAPLRARALARMERSFARAVDPDPAAVARFAERIRTHYTVGA